ncbi:extracellular solute-binding protein [Cellulomonas sp. 179-A 4D5 NHS]|uniref:sugar ABC transporter substrate-binding protein n=1 Tax=Cellulomonas sp. 179-A 4D5 NHS TaxID=3142378 RepID=UPI0039A3AEE9
MHRRTVYLVAPLAFAALLPACSSSDSGAQAGDTGTAAPAALEVWVDEARADAMKDLAGQFSSDSGVAVSVVARTSEEMRDDYVRAVDQNDAPDVLIGAHDWLGELVTQGVVAPVQNDDPGAFAPVAIEAMTYDGDTYGTPLSIENVALVRNNALVSTTPATFDELVAQGISLVQAGTALYPVLVQQGEGGDPYHLYPLQTSFGAPAFRADAAGSYTDELALGGEQGRAFATYVASLADRGVLDPGVTGDVAKAAFLAGESPYIITGPWNTAEFTDAGLDISVLPIPAAGNLPAQPFVGVQGAFVNNLSLHRAAAEDFVTDFLATPDAQLALYRETGRAPALNTALDQITDDPATTGFAEAGATGAPMPAIPQMSLVWLYWGETEARIAAGGDPLELWDQMVTNIEASIEADK